MRYVFRTTIFFSEIFGGIWISYCALKMKKKIAGAISEEFAMTKVQQRAAASVRTSHG